jgi:hypothetical protein
MLLTGQAAVWRTAAQRLFVRGVITIAALLSADDPYHAPWNAESQR